MSREDYEIFNELRREGQNAREDRRAVAELLFQPARDLAEQNGLTLRRCSETHYQLFEEGRLKNAGHWLLNVYPGNQRLYWTVGRRGPWLQLKRPWTLLDVVQAAINAREKS